MCLFLYVIIWFFLGPDIRRIFQKNKFRYLTNNMLWAAVSSPKVSFRRSKEEYPFGVVSMKLKSEIFHDCIKVRNQAMNFSRCSSSPSASITMPPAWLYSINPLMPSEKAIYMALPLSPRPRSSPVIVISKHFILSATCLVLCFLIWCT